MKEAAEDEEFNMVRSTLKHKDLTIPCMPAKVKVMLFLETLSEATSYTGPQGTSTKAFAVNFEFAKSWLLLLRTKSTLPSLKEGVL